MNNAIDTSNVNFQPVEESTGVTFIRPSKLSEPGIILEGIYVGATENGLDATKLDYAFDLASGGRAVVNSTASLARQMKSVNTGDLVQIEYLGKTKTKSGKAAHNFIVRTAREA